MARSKAEWNVGQGSVVKLWTQTLFKVGLLSAGDF